MSENKQTTEVAQYSYGVPALKESLALPGNFESFTKLLGNRTNAFVSALVNIVGNSEQLQKADTTSIILAAGQSAALNLPLNPALGMAAVVPFWDSKKQRHVAQFQVMRDGWMDLAMRSGLVKTIVNEIVYEGELVTANRFTGEYIFDPSQRKSDKIIGYMAYARLLSGFEKTIYWTVDECIAHAKQYSGNFKKGYGLWKDNFNAMALKTVLKTLIKKYMPKSAEMEKALMSDQAAFTQGEVGNAQPQYIDNTQRETQEVEAIDVEAAEVVDVETGEAKPQDAKQ